MTTKEDLTVELPSHYSDKDDSNVAKLLEIIANEIDEIKSVNDEIELIRDLDEAYGKTLDRIGENVQQERGSLDDLTFRLLIKTKIARNRSSGTINKLIEIIASMVSISEDEVIIEENPYDEYAAIYVDIPMDSISKLQLTREHFITILNRISAAGVRVYTTLEGTFQFGDVNSEPKTIFDYNHGFSNLYDDDKFAMSYSDERMMENYIFAGKEDGGYLTSWHEPEEAKELPNW